MLQRRTEGRRFEGPKKNPSLLNSDLASRTYPHDLAIPSMNLLEPARPLQPDILPHEVPDTEPRGKRAGHAVESMGGGDAVDDCAGQAARDEGGGDGCDEEGGGEEGELEDEGAKSDGGGAEEGGGQQEGRDGEDVLAADEVGAVGEDA